MNDPSDMNVYLELAHNCGWQQKKNHPSEAVNNLAIIQ